MPSSAVAAALPSRTSLQLPYTPPTCQLGPTHPPPPPPAPRLHDCELLVPTLECALVARVRRGDARLRASCGGRLALPPGEAPSAFHALEPPSISLSDYLSRIARYGFCSRSVFVAALSYLDQLAAACPELEPTSLTIHRLLITAALLATKSLDDLLYDNQHWSRVGGLDLAELNLLELDMLHRLKFKLHITQQRFAEFEADLVASVLNAKDPAYRNLRYSLSQLGFEGRSSSLPPSPQSIMGGVPDRFCQLFRVDTDDEEDEETDPAAGESSNRFQSTSVVKRHPAASTPPPSCTAVYSEKTERGGLWQRWQRQ